MGNNSLEDSVLFSPFLNRIDICTVKEMEVGGQARTWWKKIKRNRNESGNLYTVNVCWGRYLSNQKKAQNSHTYFAGFDIEVPHITSPSQFIC